MPKFIATMTIAAAAALGTLPAIAAAAPHGVQAASSSDPGIYYHTMTIAAAAPRGVQAASSSDPGIYYHA